MAKNKYLLHSIQHSFKNFKKFGFESDPYFYQIDQKLRYLRGFQDRDFGGMPVVIFTGGFLQFGPIQQKGLLSDMEQICEEYVANKLNDREVQKHSRLWEKFDNVVIP
jgi:hypothetical protein